MVNGIFFEFHAIHYAPVVLFVLGAKRSIANGVDGTVEVVLARSLNCPLKLRQDLYNKGYATIPTLGQLPATMV